MTLSEALLNFQKDAPALQRDSLNPHFKSKFISLDHLLGEIVPKLNEHGLVISQFPTTVANGDAPKPALRTRITHAESGEFLEDVMLLMPPKDDPQGQGSAITYARRYSLMSALGLVADEDDDANKASEEPRRDGSLAGSSENLVTKAQAAQAANGERPSQVAVHFGKNAGKTLAELTPMQVKWYAESWELKPDPSPMDVRLKQASVALNAGSDSPDFDIPFA